MNRILPAFFFIFLFSCQSKKKADLLIYNASIYTVDSAFTIVEAMAVKDGRILDMGKWEDLQKQYEATEKLDAQGGSIYPGFIDAHAHFEGYGNSLLTVNLVGTKSWDEVIERLVRVSSSKAAAASALIIILIISKK